VARLSKILSFSAGFPVRCGICWLGTEVIIGAPAGPRWARARSAIRRDVRMANWRKLAMAAILADGKIDETEVKLLRKELFADKKIDNEERDFLIELRNAAQKKAKNGKLSPAFEKLFFSAIEQNVLQDGVIDADEAKWLQKLIFADKKVDDSEKKFLERLKKGAKKTSPEFEALYAKCMSAGKK
jgi:hypothetical protein